VESARAKNQLTIRKMSSHILHLILQGSGLQRNGKHRRMMEFVAANFLKPELQQKIELYFDG
jgi:hypothetical protein